MGRCAGSACIAQIQLFLTFRKHVPDRADYTAPSRQHELDHTYHTRQGSIYLP